LQGIVSKLIVYIHGFNGHVDSPKVEALRVAHRDAVVEAPEYDDNNAQKSFTKLTQYFSERVKKYDEIVIVGCSLGGFWAHYFANQFRLPALLLNPSMQPWTSLQKYVGENGFTKQQADQFHDFAFKYALPKTVFEPRIVLLETGDKVLDARHTATMFQGAAKVKTLPGGSHRFDNYIEMNKAVTELFNTVIH
jgi:predicted esterase YcpF (UPF0227 family)